MTLIATKAVPRTGEGYSSVRDVMPGGSRQHLMRLIGVFEKIDGEYVGHIATLNFKCDAVIKDNARRSMPAEPEYAVFQVDGDTFSPEIGFGWEKVTAGNNIPYMVVHLDDPSFPKTIVAVLIKSFGNKYNLYWDRITICDDDIERMWPTEELQPYVGVLRPIDKPTDYLISIYPSLQEIYDPDYD